VSGSGISWAVCKSAPRSRQITTPVPHRSVFYRPDALPAAQPTASKHWKHNKDKEHFKHFYTYDSVGSTARHRLRQHEDVDCTTSALTAWRHNDMWLSSACRRNQHHDVGTITRGVNRTRESRVSIFFSILGKEFLDFRESRLMWPPVSGIIVTGRSALAISRSLVASRRPWHAYQTHRRWRRETKDSGVSTR